MCHEAFIELSELRIKIIYTYINKYPIPREAGI